MKTGIETKGMSGKPVATETPYGYVKDADNKDFRIIDVEAAAIRRTASRRTQTRKQAAWSLTLRKAASLFA